MDGQAMSGSADRLVTELVKKQSQANSLWMSGEHRCQPGPQCRWQAPSVTHQDAAVGCTPEWQNPASAAIFAVKSLTRPLCSVVPPAPAMRTAVAVTETHAVAILLCLNFRVAHISVPGNRRVHTHVKKRHQFTSHTNVMSPPRHCARRLVGFRGFFLVEVHQL